MEELELREKLKIIEHERHKLKEELSSLQTEEDKITNIEKKYTSSSCHY
jgi:hypothetical protein